MTVKSKRGRRRYIAFTLDSKFDRTSLISGLRSVAGDAAPYVVQCSEGWCIVRCTPDRREETIALMGLVDPSAVSLRTSGTLITLRRRYPRLEETRPPARR